MSAVTGAARLPPDVIHSSRNANPRARVHRQPIAYKWDAVTIAASEPFLGTEVSRTMPGDRLARRLALCSAVACCTAAACARPAVRPEPRLRVDRCLIAAPPATAPDSLTIAASLSRITGFSAPARVSAVRALAELMRETLIGVDCTGALVPEAAERWEVDQSGRQWTFTLRADALWAVGEPVTSWDVIAGWRRSVEHRPAFSRIVDGAVAIDARRIRVTVIDGDARVLAAPELAVVRYDDSQLHATGAYGAGGVPRAVGGLNASTTRLPRLVWMHEMGFPDLDGRDLLDRGADVLLADDPAVARYAMAREGLAVHPLPPQRTYAVIAPAAGPQDDAAFATLTALRASLARDVVQVPSRPASSPSWWRDSSACELADSAAAGPPTRRVYRIAYPADDPVARSIAERLVSLSSAASDSVLGPLLDTTERLPEPLTAEPMSETALVEALRARSRMAFIVSVATRPLARCSALSDLARALPWAIERGRLTSSAFIPLVEAGGWAIVRRGAVGISADWDGTPRLVFSAPADVSP